MFLNLTLEITLKEENKPFSNANTVVILNIPRKSFIVKKVRTVIKNLHPKKVPGYDLIINQVSQKLLHRNRNKIYHPTNIVTYSSDRTFFYSNGR